jgi:hypothetical protein
MVQVRKQQITWAVSLALFAVMLISVNAWLHRGVQVILFNDGQHPVRDVIISFAGGERRTSLLPDRGRYVTRVNPTGESHLELQFRDPSGNERKAVVDVYIEPNYTGRVLIRIDSSARVTSTDQVEIGS